MLTAVIATAAPAPGGQLLIGLLLPPAVLAVSLSAEWAGDDYAEYYYSIDPAGSLASGLPVFDADGGFKHWRVGLFANQSLSGNLLHGWSIFGVGLYTKLSGDFADSPIVDDRGSSSQWFGGRGVADTW